MCDVSGFQVDTVKQVVVCPNNRVIPFDAIQNWSCVCETYQVPESSWFPSNKPYIEYRQGPSVVTTLTLKSGEVVQWSTRNPAYNCAD